VSLTDPAVPRLPDSLSGVTARALPAPAVRRHYGRGRRTPGASVVPFVVLTGSGIVTFLADEWIVGVAMVILWVAWEYLSREKGPPVIALAFTHQWTQVMIAVVYLAVTGRRVPEMNFADYRPMLLVGLGTIVSLFGGFYLGSGRLRPPPPNRLDSPELPIPLPVLGVAYVVAALSAGLLIPIAFIYFSGLTQILLTLNLVRYVLLFLVTRRLVVPRLRWGWLSAIFVWELVIGFTGYFAGFREPAVIMILAILEGRSRIKLRAWVFIGLLGLLVLFVGVLWTGIKPAFRGAYQNTTRWERVGLAVTLSKASLSKGRESMFGLTDRLVARMWTIYYPALALERVPRVIPHTNGTILWSAIANLAPRMFFPNKPALPSDSDKVRKYSGVWVAGREIYTSYAFGYAAESYVDFGIPLMFAPVFVWGLLLGAARARLARAIRHQELRIAVLLVISWYMLFLFERAWVLMIGLTITQLVVIGGGAVVLDNIMLQARKSVKRVGAFTSGSSRGPIAGVQPPQRRLD
jgi:hypothetical protein